MGFEQANHVSYSNPGTQLGTQKKDFRAVLQTDLACVQPPPPLRKKLKGPLL